MDYRQQVRRVVKGEVINVPPRVGTIDEPGYIIGHGYVSVFVTDSELAESRRRRTKSIADMKPHFERNERERELDAAIDRGDVGQS